MVKIESKLKKESKEKKSKSSKKTTKSLSSKKIVKKSLSSSSSQSTKIEKCKKEFCEKEAFKVIDKMEPIMIKLFENSLPEKYKHFTKEIPSMLKEFKNGYKEKIIKQCELAYCNPGCKKTIYQNGKNFPNNIEINMNMKMKDNKFLTEDIKKELNVFSKVMINTIKKMRERIFHGKTSILKNDFYEGLKTVDELKKKGAISGCTHLNTTSNNSHSGMLMQQFLKSTGKSIKNMMFKINNKLESPVKSASKVIKKIASDTTKIASKVKGKL